MIQVASHQVQLAALVEACKRRQMLSRNSVGLQVFALGESFMIGAELWRGLAILSPDALFLLKAYRQSPEGTSLPGRASDTNLDFCAKALLTVKYTDLPPLLTEDAGWPKPPSLDCEVAVLLREDARNVRAVPFTTELEFQSESARIRVTCSSAGPNLAAQRLHRTGWVKNAQGGPVSLAVEPPPSRPVPYILIASLLAFVLATVIAIQLESMNTQLTLLLSLPILALVSYLVLRHTGHWPHKGPSDQ